MGVELSFTWWVIFFELFVLLAAFAHVIGESVPDFSNLELMLTLGHCDYAVILLEDCRTNFMSANFLF